MADLTDIRQGMAALLRAALPADKGHVSAWFEDSPNTPSLQVAGVEEMDRIDFVDGGKWLIAVEGCIGLTTEVGAQKLLDGLVDAVADAVESDGTPNGALFSRLQEDGTILTNQSAAADAVAFVRYRGQGKHTADDGTQLLLASWLFEVIA